MANSSYTGTEFIGPFFLLCAALWIGGAIFFVSMASIGAGRAGTVLPASNQTPIANSPATQ